MRMRDLIIAALATYRIVRLVIGEEGPFGLAQKLRNVADPDQRSWVGRGLNCPWCISFWIGPVAVCAGRSRVGSVIVQGLAVSSIVGLAMQATGLFLVYAERLTRRSSYGGDYSRRAGTTRTNQQPSA